MQPLTHIHNTQYTPCISKMNAENDKSTVTRTPAPVHYITLWFLHITDVVEPLTWGSQSL